MYLYSEEIKADKAKIRVDIHSEKEVNCLLEDVSFLNYRLAGVEVIKNITQEEPDFVWYREKENKSILYKDDRVILEGEWYQGEIQKILVSLLARRMVEKELYLFHASAVNYQGKTIMFMSGESNSGKTMCQIETCKRGGKIVSTETIVTDPAGNVVMGSKNVFLRVRAKGTERIDKPNQDEGVQKFFSKTPEFELYEVQTNIDLVIMPDIDGHFSTMVGKMADFEKQYQTFHCLCDYFGDHELLAPGLPMPMFDTQELRYQRANFIKEFTKRPYYFMRAKNPQIILDEIESIL
ncbi:MAG: hypothetical protein JG764_2232 [Clostridiales bacterium]|nr:hypothetical protein [Clostridiales bacterium]